MSARFEKLKNFLSASTSIPADEIPIDEHLLQEIHFKKNQMILTAGNTCHQVIFVVSGLIRNYYLKDGVEINSGFYKENSLACSFASLVNRTPSTLSMQAIEDTEALVLSYDNLTNLYQRSDIWQEIGRIMTEKECVYLADRVNFLNFESAKVKYLNLMKEEPELIQRISVQHLASYIGVSRETLSRIRSAICIL